MALLFIDSFDSYVTADFADRYSVTGIPTVSAGNGRHGSASMRSLSSSTNLVRGIPPSSTIIIGCGVRANSHAASAVRVFGLHDAGIDRTQVFIRINADGSISALRGTNTGGINPNFAGTVIGTTTPGGTFPAAIYQFLEAKFVLHDTLGSVIVRINGAVVFTVTNVDTSNGSTTPTSAFVGSAGNDNGNTWDFDDLYILDNTGAAPWNDFLGDVRADLRAVTAAGATTGWTPSAGANWQCVDDAAPNDDTDYTAALAAGLTDTFVTQDAPVPGAPIYGVQIGLNARKTDAGAASIAGVIRHAGVDSIGADLNPSLTYGAHFRIAQVNPGTGLAWTEAEFNAAEFGYRRTV